MTRFGRATTRPPRKVIMIDNVAGRFSNRDIVESGIFQNELLSPMGKVDLRDRNIQYITRIVFILNIQKENVPIITSPPVCLFLGDTPMKYGNFKYLYLKVSFFKK